MGIHRLLRETALPEVQGDAGIRRGSVPVAPVVGEIAQRFRHLLTLRLELLEADDIGTLACNEVHQLGLARPDAVDVPGDDLHGRTFTQALEARKRLRPARSKTPFTKGMTRAFSCAMVVGGAK